MSTPPQASEPVAPAAAPDFLSRWLARVRADPGAPAIEHEGALIYTHASLHVAVQRLAATLIDAGANPQDIVALVLPRGPDFVVGVLACWWAGLAFLPLDPEGPSARRADMLRRSGCRFALGEAAEFAEFAESDGLRVVEVPNTTGPASLKRVPFDPQALAYLMFTSGSSGSPKGVLVEHAGIAALVDAQIEAFALCPNSRALWLLSPIFDASVSDLTTTLAAGACLCIEPAAPSADAAQLMQILERRRITHLDLPPALLRLLDPAAAPACLQCLVVGGEVADPPSLRAWARRLRVVNVYGPTEATVCTSLSVVGPDSWSPASIGRPIPGVNYQLEGHLDGQGQCQTSQLVISGPAVARGYLDRSRREQARFGLTADGRPCYRSGDRVRAEADGSYTFLGRIDRQFKLDGRLIAPEEVEQTLLQDERVARAAVLALPRGLRKILVAAVQAQPSDLQSIQARLSEALPSWMLPRRVVCLAALPLMTSGKVDYEALKRSLWENFAPSDGHGLASTASEMLTHLRALVPEQPSLDLETPFASLALGSLDRVEFLARCAHLGVTASEFANAPNLAALLQTLSERSRHAEATTTDELRRDVDSILRELMPEDGSPTDNISLARPKGPPHYLVTGSTGQLGAALVRELLQRSTAPIACLVRAGDPEHARRRLKDALGEAYDPARVQPLVGDLAQVQLGLDDTTYQRLAANVSDIFACAAQVRLTQSYQQLREANVVGTVRLLALNHEGHAKQLHFVSTLSVFVASERHQGTHLEADTLDAIAELHGGYAQSKWAAEFACRRASRLPSTLNIYRLGLLVANRQPTAGAPDWLPMLVRGLASMGAAPSLHARADDLCFDWTPVSFAAAAIAHIGHERAHHPDAPVACYHLAGSGKVSLAQLVAAIEACGVSIQAMSFRDWSDHVGRLGPLDADASAAALALSRASDDVARFDQQRALDIFQASDTHFDMRNAERALGDSRITCPPPSHDALVREVAAHLNSQRADTQPSRDCP